MPCMDYETPSERGVRLKRERDVIRAPLREQIDQLQRSLAEREAQLCAVLSSLSNLPLGVYDKLDPWASVMERIDAKEAVYGVSMDSIQTWWDEHQKRDLARLEQVRAQALEKLTPEERLALGLQ
jgi:hypothetical protein